jgi:hypothetical protein
MADAAGDNPLAIESETMGELAHQVVDMLIARLSDPESGSVRACRVVDDVMARRLQD